MDQQSYREIVSGKRTGVGAGLLRLGLRILAIPYSIATRLRNFLYSAGLFKSQKVNAAVICVGNITAGGTGKTPIVIWLCNELLNNPKIKSRDCAILTRGYKSDKDRSDEPALLSQSCSGIPVIVNPDRVAGAREAVEKYKAKVLIMDDGFQHRRLHRDMDIVVIDATRPFGYGKVLPAGMLREPLSGLRRACAYVITRCDQVSDEKVDQIENKLREINSKALIAKSIHRPSYINMADNQKIELAGLEGKKVFAFCGIGNPEAFLATLKSLGLELSGSKIFNDHHVYTSECLRDITSQARKLNAEMLLTTLKDWTKLQALLQGQEMPLGYLAVEIKFTDGEEELRSLIDKAVQGRISHD